MQGTHFLTLVIIMHISEEDGLMLSPLQSRYLMFWCNTDKGAQLQSRCYLLSYSLYYCVVLALLLLWMEKIEMCSAL